MDQENLPSDQSSKYPNLEIAQLKFKISLPEHSNDEELKKKLLDIIILEEMGPYYEIVWRDLGWTLQDKIIQELKEKNATKLAELDKAIDDALENLSTIDVKDAYLNKANYLCKIGDKENTIKALSQAYDNTVALGGKLENMLKRLHLGLFFMDLDLVHRGLQQGESLMELGADWQSRNCFNFCRALHCIAIRLNYKIDKVSAKIVNVPLQKNSEVFKAVIKQGDLLLNRIHKLGRVINI
nr:unnamed protein product [Callosobruchus chinensis]